MGRYRYGGVGKLFKKVKQGSDKILGMRKVIKEIKKLFRSWGFDIVSNKKAKLSNRDLIDHDIKVVIKKDNPVVFDIGANKGQSIELYKSLFKNATVYSFEPNPELQEILLKKYHGRGDVIINPVALGERDEDNEFIIFENSELSSFKPMESNKLNPFSGEKIKTKSVTQVLTLDTYLKKNNVESIDLLKIDTQGYEFEILKGSLKTLEAKVIKNIYLELTLVPLYKNQSNYIDVISLLDKYNYQLVGFYEMRRYNNYIEWANGLFTLVEK